MSIYVALLSALTELDKAVLDYAEAARAAAEAEASYRGAQDHLTRVEDAHRDIARRAGLAGSNEAERTARLKVILNTTDVVNDARLNAEAATGRRDSAHAEARIADARQKACRTKVAALTALVNGDE